MSISDKEIQIIMKSSGVFLASRFDFGEKLVHASRLIQAVIALREAGLDVAISQKNDDPEMSAEQLINKVREYKEQA